MQTPDNTLGPPPEWEVDRTEFCVEVPVLVTIEADADADHDALKREAIKNLSDALNGAWGFLVDATPDECGIGYV